MGNSLTLTKDDTPNSVLDKAKDAIKAAGGMITHEYKLIKVSQPYHHVRPRSDEGEGFRRRSACEGPRDCSNHGQ